MSRLLTTLLVCLALQAAAPAAACAHDQATIGVDHGGGGAQLLLPAPDVHSWVVVPPRADRLVAPSLVATDARVLGAPVAIARLWLRGARLLC